MGSLRYGLGDRFRPAPRERKGAGEPGDLRRRKRRRPGHLAKGGGGLAQSSRGEREREREERRETCGSRGLSVVWRRGGGGERGLLDSSRLPDLKKIINLFLKKIALKTAPKALEAILSIRKLKGFKVIFTMILLVKLGSVPVRCYEIANIFYLKYMDRTVR